ncbi:MAG: hypothetical protein ACOC22_00715 [bacterium]
MQKLYCYIDNDGNIGNPQKLPSNYNNIVNFDSLSKEKLIKYGFYLYEIPDYDPKLEKLGKLILDNSTNTVTKEVLNKSLDIEKEKEKKINRVKNYTEKLLSKTDKYYIRKMERGVEVPNEIEDERTFIHDETDKMKEYINNLDNVEDVLNISFNLDPSLNYH